MADEIADTITRLRTVQECGLGQYARSAAAEGADALEKIAAENATLRGEIERLSRLLDNANSKWELPQ